MSSDTSPGLERVRVDRPGRGVEDDWVAVEAPLEIRLDDEPLVVTMREVSTSTKSVLSSSATGTRGRLAAGAVPDPRAAFGRGVAPQPLAQIEARADAVAGVEVAAAIAGQRTAVETLSDAGRAAEVDTVAVLGALDGAGAAGACHAARGVEGAVDVARQAEPQVVPPRSLPPQASPVSTTPLPNSGPTGPVRSCPGC